MLINPILQAHHRRRKAQEEFRVRLTQSIGAASYMQRVWRGHAGRAKWAVRLAQMQRAAR